MAGESRVAQDCIAQAFDTAAQQSGMSEDSMGNALLSALLARLVQTRTRKDLKSLIEFQIESAGEDEFVITRGS